MKNVPRFTKSPLARFCLALEEEGSGTTVLVLRSDLELVVGYLKAVAHEKQMRKVFEVIVAKDE